MSRASKDSHKDGYEYGWFIGKGACRDSEGDWPDEEDREDASWYGNPLFYDLVSAAGCTG